MLSHSDARSQPPDPPPWAVGLWTSPTTAADLVGIAPELVEDLVARGLVPTERRGSRIPVDALWRATQGGATR
jgi:hypothetical protein